MSPIDQIEETQDINLLETTSSSGSRFIDTYPHEEDEKIQELAAKHLPTQEITEKETKLSTIVKPIETTFESNVSDVKEFMEEAKEYEETKKITFDLEDLEKIFSEYIHYMAEYKRVMTQCKNKAKQAFQASIKSYSDSFRNPTELILSVGIAAVQLTGGVASFGYGNNQRVTNTFIAGCKSIADGGSAISGFVSTKLNGQRTEGQIMSDSMQRNQEDVNQTPATAGRKQEEISQKLDQITRSNSDTARSLLQG